MSSNTCIGNNDFFHVVIRTGQLVITSLFLTNGFSMGDVVIVRLMLAGDAEDH